jgi:uncharacterized protein (TIGR02058 family)
LKPEAASEDKDAHATEVEMTQTAYVLEFGMGVDLHGEDSTKAACRAVFDALRHSSLPLLQDIRGRGGEMVVDVTVAVPNAGSVDLDVVKRECPHGDVSVKAIEGGLRVPDRDTLIACASIMVSGRYPE